ncbi:MAG: hypothetical protein ABW169_07620 [Sphingobium sp.]
MIAALLMRVGLTARAGKTIAIVLIMLLVTLGAIWTVQHIQRQEATIDSQQIVIQGQAAEMEMMRVNQDALDAASAAREADTVRINDQVKETTHAIDKASDGAPSDAAVRLGCDRLRRAGRDTSAYPACR